MLWHSTFVSIIIWCSLALSTLNWFTKHIIEENTQGYTRREDKKEDVSSYCMTLSTDRVLETDRENTISHCVENSLWKRLWTCCKKDCYMNDVIDLHCIYLYISSCISHYHMPLKTSQCTLKQTKFYNNDNSGRHDFKNKIDTQNGMQSAVWLLQFLEEHTALRIKTGNTVKMT